MKRALTGILMIRAYHAGRGDMERTEVLVPDSAHGTNPATAALPCAASVIDLNIVARAVIVSIFPL